MDAVVHRSGRCVGALLIALLGTALLAGCGGRLDAQGHIDRAKTFITKGEARAAVIELKSALQQQPDNRIARSLLADVYLKGGMGAEAEKELRRLRKLGGTPAMVRLRLARALMLQRKFKDVLETLGDPGRLPADQRARAYYLRGEAELGRGKTVPAAAQYRRALAVDPALMGAHLGLVRIGLLGDDYPLARKQLDEALRLDPEDRQAWVLNGEYHMEAGERGRARRAFEHVLKKDPQYVPALLGMARLSLAQGDAPAVVRYARQAEKAAPGSLIARYLLALGYYNRHEFAKANSVLLTVLNGAPGHLPTVLLLGATNYALGNYEQARMYLNRYLAAKPDSVPARKLLAAVRLKIHEPKRALQLLQPIAAGASKDRALLALLGEAAFGAGRYAEATSYLKRAVAAAPGNGRLRTQLALGYLASGDTAAGIRELESTLKVGSDVHGAAGLLVRTYLREGRRAKALEVAQGLTRKEPKNPAVWNMLGALNLVLGHDEEAGANFERAVALDPKYVLGVLNLGRLDLRAGRSDRARARFEQVLKLDPANVTAMIALATLRYRAHDLDGAGVWLTKAHETAPKALRPRLLLVQLRLAKRDAPGAMDLARETLAAHPDNPVVLSVAAGAYLAGGDTTSALTALTHLTEVAPRAASAWYRLGDLQVRLGEHKRAARSLAKALRLRPDFNLARGVLALLEAQTGHAKEAMALAREARKRHPDAAFGYELAGDLDLRAGRYAAAARAYRTGYEKAPQAGLAAKWYAAERRRGATRKTVLATLRAWSKARPKDVALDLVVAGVLTDFGQRDTAINVYRGILKREPKNVVALNNLAWLYSEAGNPQAIRYAREAHKLAPDQVAPMDTLGWALVRRGRAKAGLALLRQAVEKAPNNAEIRYHRAVALVKTGTPGAARRDLQTLMKSKADFPSRKAAEKLLAQIGQGSR
ncbi:MAG TPA: PEP-CTERM system TPR-repeat protein PrsT [Chromatiales bacterium]|nr:PEP-CTERM system TPR-repeat protein PrsT [Chromatiales bacterium]